MSWFALLAVDLFCVCSGLTEFELARQFDVALDVDGEACSSSSVLYDPSSFCGYGFVCLGSSKGRCVQDYSKPQFLLRPASDLGFLDAARIFSLAHVIDDRMLASTSANGVFSFIFPKSSSLQFSEAEQTSIAQLTACSIPLDPLSQYNHKFMATSSLQLGLDFLSSKLYQLNSHKHFPLEKEPKSCTYYLSNYKNYAKPSAISKLSNNRILLRDHCFSDSADLLQELRTFGPVMHDIRVFSELLEFDSLDITILTDSAIRAWEKARDLRSRTHFEGYTSVVIAGYGFDRTYGHYFVVKFHWGADFGEKGYVKMDHEVLFERYMARCDDTEYQWKKSEEVLYPLLSYRNPHPVLDRLCDSFVDSDLTQQIEQTICRSLYSRTFRRSSYIELKAENLLLAPIDYIASKRNRGRYFNQRYDYIRRELGKSEREFEIAESRKLLKSVMSVINDQNHKVNQDAKKRGFYQYSNQYALINVVHLDVTIVSGRKYFVLLELLSKNIHSGRYVYPEVSVFYEAVVYLPIKTSYTNLLFSKFQVLSGKFITVNAYANSILHGTHGRREGEGWWSALVEYMRLPTRIQTVVLGVIGGIVFFFRWTKLSPYEFSSFMAYEIGEEFLAQIRAMVPGK